MFSCEKSTIFNMAAPDTAWSTSALDISPCGYQSHIASLQMIHTFITVLLCGLLEKLLQVISIKLRILVNNTRINQWSIIQSDICFITDIGPISVLIGTTLIFNSSLKLPKVWFKKKKQDSSGAASFTKSSDNKNKQTASHQETSHLAVCLQPSVMSGNVRLAFPKEEHLASADSGNTAPLWHHKGSWISPPN